MFHLGWIDTSYALIQFGVSLQLIWVIYSVLFHFLCL